MGKCKYYRSNSYWGHITVVWRRSKKTFIYKYLVE